MSKKENITSCKCELVQLYCLEIIFYKRQQLTSEAEVGLKLVSKFMLGNYFLK